MATLMAPATPATVAQQPCNGLLQTPPRNSLATTMGATPATAPQRLCNKAQQRCNGQKKHPRNSATAPYRGELLLRSCVQRAATVLRRSRSHNHGTPRRSGNPTREAMVVIRVSKGTGRRFSKRARVAPARAFTQRKIFFMGGGEYERRQTGYCS